MTRFDALVERARRPEYTGENRCWPCTALNLAILAVLRELSNGELAARAADAAAGDVEGQAHPLRMFLPCGLRGLRGCAVRV